MNGRQRNYHLILTNGRSGSNFITNLINSHPNAVNYNEILGPWTVTSKYFCKLPYIRNLPKDRLLNIILTNPVLFYLAQSYSIISNTINKEKIKYKPLKHIKTVGVKDFSILFYRFNIDSFFSDNRPIKVINLYRENILKRYISLARMTESGIVKLNKTSDVKSIKKIKIDTQHLLKDLSNYEQELNEQMKLAETVTSDNLLNLKYEDLFNSNESLTEYSKKILEFLGLEPLEVTSSHKKISPDSIRESILNYNEVCDKLSGTCYEKFLD